MGEQTGGQTDGRAGGGEGGLLVVVRKIGNIYYEIMNEIILSNLRR